jgi:Carboxypeptidase regulatory-like domain
MSHSKLFRLLILSAFLMAFAFIASAQEATIVGTISDPSGAAVPGAQITIINTETGFARHMASNETGQYAVPDLHIGHYTVHVEAAGFKVAEKNDIVLQVGDRTRVDLALEIGTATESIKVEANPIAVKSDTGEVSNVITDQEVSQIATNGRSIYSLALLVPGTSNNMPGFQAPTANGANANIAFNGQRQNHNLWLADGAEQSDRGGAGGSIIAPSLDALAEFRALTSNYSSEYGLSSAGTMSMVFKSGSKDFHASAWEFVRNNDFDANDFFRNEAGQPTQELRLNTFGFNAGGPVTFGRLYNKDRNKTFFFYNMEWRKMIQQAGNINVTVPPTAAYGGDLGYLLQLAKPVQLTVPGASQLSASQLAKFAAAGLQPGQPIKNNLIPSSLLDPNAQALLKAGIFPAPNNGTAFVGGNNLPTNVREELVRIDHQFSDRFWVFGHYVAEQTSQTYEPTMWSGVNVPTVGNTFGNPSYTGVIHATYAISPTLLSETAFNYDGNRISIIPNGVVARPSDVTIPELFPSNNGNRLPGIQLGGSTGSNFDVTSFPWHNRCDDYQVREDVSWAKGSHQMKMGGSWAIYKKQQDLFGDSQGLFNFNGAYTGNDFADFLLGYANTYNELAVQDSGQWNAVSWAAYFQDNWRVNNRLTLNLGLRWDGIPHTYEANHRMSNFYPNQYNPADAAILLPNGTISPNSPGLGTSPNSALSAFQFYLNGIGITGENGNPNGMVDNHWAAFGPRFGFAYDLTGAGKTVLRGGFGAMYERIQGNDMYNSGANIPFSASVTNNGVSLSNPNTSLSTGLTLTAPISVANLTALSETNYKNPVTYQFSLGVEEQLGHATVLSASYVGNQSRHQFDYQDINLPDPGLLPALINKTVSYNTVLPYRGFGVIAMGENGENAHYNGMQLSVRSQLKKDLSIQGAYTLSRSMDPAESFGGDNTSVYNPYNVGYDWGPSLVDATHIGVLSFVYDLPVFRNTGNRFEKSVLGGWQLSGIWSIQSGFPVPIVLGGAQGANGLTGSNTSVPTNRPNFNGTITYTDTAAQWFTTSGFSTPAIGAWGDLKKGAIRGPGRDNWNMSLFKSFLLSEARGSHFEFRFETFNTLNHTQFNLVGASYSNAAQFGKPITAWDPRQLQLGAKLIF